MPHGVEVDVDAFLRKNGGLLERKYYDFLSQIRLITDDKILYQGEEYSVKIVLGQTPEDVNVDNDIIVIRCVRLENAARILKKWMTKQTQKRVNEVIEQYKAKLGEPARVSVTETARWGYCRDNSIIIFNWQLSALPQNLSEFIIVHELVHLTHPNHQRGFHYKMMKVIPDYVLRDKELRKYLAADDDFELKHRFANTEDV
jgi:predicted metal-dependent hydrolase